MFTVQVKSYLNGNPEPQRQFKTEAQVKAYLKECESIKLADASQGDGWGALEYDVTPPLSYYEESPQFDQGGYYVG